MIWLGLAFFAAGLLSFLAGYWRGRRAGQLRGFSVGFTRGVIVTAHTFAGGHGEFVEVGVEHGPDVAEAKPN